jgi:thioredoxin reductase (NADPH)
MDEKDAKEVPGAADRPPDHVYDVVIIGGGAGGLTAALYCGRYRLDTLVMEKHMFFGGQMITTQWVENYPGFEDPVLGNELAKAMEFQAVNTGVETLQQTVTKLELDKKIKIIHTSQRKFRTKAIILSTGATARELGIPGEREFRGKGVSYCATCDGPFFPDKEIAVVGGGNSALEESLFLAKYAKKIYLIHRRDKFRADKILQERVFQEKKIEILYNSNAREIHFEDQANPYIIYAREGEEKRLPVEGIFIFIGLDPNNQLFKDLLELDEGGYVVTDCDMNTSVPGVYAVGDLRQKNLRQIATAVGDGATAAYSANRYVEEFT